MRWGTAIAALAIQTCMAGTIAAQDQSCAGAGLKLNEIQLIGTHNSYHIEPDPAVTALLLRTNYVQNESWPAERLVPAIGYTHAPLDVQLTYGVRHIEIDIYRDDKGGRFADPTAYRALGIAFAAADEMKAPGFKVIHAADLDVRSNCTTLTACLKTVRDWSDKNRTHVPIVIQLEAKEGESPAVDGHTPTIVDRFDAETFRDLDREIRSVMPIDQILTPDAVRGAAPSLNAAIKTTGWPRLADVQGRVMLTLGDTKATPAYLEAFPGAQGGLLFPSVAPGNADTAWLNIDNPTNPKLTGYVREGYMVYARADTHTKHARKNDTSRRDRAFASGAQIISTDFPWPDRRYSPYRVGFEGTRFVRANPVLTKASCEESAGSAGVPSALH